jgi:hypothetical protein
MRSHAIPLLLSLVLLPLPAAAWEAEVFKGDAADATLEDLMPRIADRGAPYYSEDYTFTFRLAGTVGMQLKIGMSNLLGGEGSAFADGWVTTRGKRRRISRTWEKGKWNSAADRFALTMEDLDLKGTPRKLKLRFEADGAAVDAELEAVVPGFRPGTGKVVLEDQGYVSIAVWPKFAVTGSVKVGEKSFRLAGYALLTHAVSTVPPQHMPATWYYFKGDDFDNPVLFQAFQLPEAFGGTLHGWALAVEQDRYLFRSHRIVASPTALKDTRGATLPWALLLADADAAMEGAIKAERLRSVRDRLARLPSLQAAIIRKFIDPRRYFFAGKIELKVGKRRIRADGEYKVDTMR